jgi:hypothetical protein
MSTVDWVVLIITIGALGIGLLSMLAGKAVEMYDRVKSSGRDITRPLPPQEQTKPQTTDRRADRLSVSAVFEEPPRLQLDRTRAAVIEELLTLGWTMTDFRREQIFRGDNNKISAEVDAARKRLGIEAPENRAPISGRPLPAGVSFHSDAPELEYQPPS